MKLKPKSWLFENHKVTKTLATINIKKKKERYQLPLPGMTDESSLHILQMQTE